MHSANVPFEGPLKLSHQFRSRLDHLFLSFKLQVTFDFSEDFELFVLRKVKPNLTFILDYQLLSINLGELIDNEIHY